MPTVWTKNGSVGSDADSTITGPNELAIIGFQFGVEGNAFTLRDNILASQKWGFESIATRGAIAYLTIRNKPANERYFTAGEVMAVANDFLEQAGYVGIIFDSVSVNTTSFETFPEEEKSTRGDLWLNIKDAIGLSTKSTSDGIDRKLWLILAIVAVVAIVVILLRFKRS